MEENFEKDNIKQNNLEDNLEIKILFKRMLRRNQ